jgi:hypothetical protein
MRRKGERKKKERGQWESKLPISRYSEYPTSHQTAPAPQLYNHKK